jgi:Lar family restriction alleviation protein
MSELLPCPFCGNEEIFLNEPSSTYRKGCINCPACLATMPAEVNTDELIEAWNTRASDWQPIETAPKDRNLIVAEGSHVAEAYYDGESDMWFRAGKHPNDHDFVRSDRLFPTHWQLLPAPPVEPTTLGQLGPVESAQIATKDLPPVESKSEAAP